MIRAVACDNCAARLEVEMPTDLDLAALMIREMDQALARHMCAKLETVEIDVGFSPCTSRTT